MVLELINHYKINYLNYFVLLMMIILTQSNIELDSVYSYHPKYVKI